MKITKPVLLAAGAILALNFVANQLPPSALIESAKAVALLLIVTVTGFLVLDMGGRPAKPRDFIDYVGAGLAATTLYFFALSMFRALNPLTLSLYFALPPAAFLFRLRDRVRRERALADGRALWQRHPGEWLVFFLPFLYAVLPTVFFDTLAYNSALANFFLQNGGFVRTPQFMFANGFIYHETLLIPAVFLGDHVPRLLQLLLGAVFILAALDFGCREFRLQKRRVLLLTLFSLPMTLFLITAEKADLVTALFIFLAIKKYRENETGLSALFWGFAVGCKSFSVIAAAAFFLVAIPLSGRLQLKRHLGMAAIALLVVLPLLVKNAVFAGNPFFPFLSGQFPNEFWDASRARLVAAEVGARIHSVQDLLRAPYTFSFQAHGAGGFVGPVFLIFLPFLLLRGIAAGQRIFLYFPLLLVLASSFFGNASRYVYIAFVLLSMVVAAIYEQQERRLLRFLFAAVILANLATGLFMLEGIYEAKQVYYKKMPLADYAAAHFPMYRVYQRINREAPPGARVLVSGETRGYYLRRPHMIASAYDYNALKKYIAPAASGRSLLAAVRADGYDYLVFNLAEFIRLARYRQLSPEESKKLLALLGECQPAFSQESIYVFRLT